VSVHCCAHEPPELTDGRYRRVLWAALAINGAMFIIEIIAGLMRKNRLAVVLAYPSGCLADSHRCGEGPCVHGSIEVERFY
jgi:hypothetical protein